MAETFKTLMLNPKDSVAIALERLPEGVTVIVSCEDIAYTIRIQQAIEFGHKFAVKTIENGEAILKYGEVIGKASSLILSGEHVHVHNLEGTRGRGDILDTI